MQQLCLKSLSPFGRLCRVLVLWHTGLHLLTGSGTFHWKNCVSYSSLYFTLVPKKRGNNLTSWSLLSDLWLNISLMLVLSIVFNSGYIFGKYQLNPATKLFMKLCRLKMHKPNEMENRGSDVLDFPYYCKVKVNIVTVFFTNGFSRTLWTLDVLFFLFGYVEFESATRNCQL